MSSESLNERLKIAIMNGRKQEAEDTAREILEAAIDPLEVIARDLNPAMKFVGEKFEKGEYFLTDLMLAGEAMKTASEVLTRRIIQEGKQNLITTKARRVVIGAVSGDIHDIGKNIVAVLLEVNGFDTYDLGKDVDSMKFIEKATETQANIVALSALMTTTKPSQKEVIDLLNDMALRGKYKVIVGGAATSEEWAEEIRADGWAETAEQAVRLAQKLIAEE